jgi:hypothetical protein
MLSLFFFDSEKRLSDVHRQSLLGYNITSYRIHQLRKRESTLVDPGMKISGISQQLIRRIEFCINHIKIPLSPIHQQTQRCQGERMHRVRSDLYYWSILGSAQVVKERLHQIFLFSSLLFWLVSLISSHSANQLGRGSVRHVTTFDEFCLDNLHYGLTLTVDGWIAITNISTVTIG